MKTASVPAIFSLVVLLFVAVAEAQQAEKVRRIGFLGGAFPASNPARHEALRQGLRALGWVEGKNITIEYRFAEGNRERLPKLAIELVPLPVDLIVTGGPAATRAVKEANVHSYCHGVRQRSRRIRVRRQFGATRWEHHWFVYSFAGDQRKTVRAA
jgi:ABC-type uncharacterized transport system substrate-binding protein